MSTTKPPRLTLACFGYQSKWVLGLVIGLVNLVLWDKILNGELILKKSQSCLLWLKWWTRRERRESTTHAYTHGGDVTTSIYRPGVFDHQIYWPVELVP